MKLKLIPWSNTSQLYPNSSKMTWKPEVSLQLSSALTSTWLSRHTCTQSSPETAGLRTGSSWCWARWRGPRGCSYAPRRPKTSCCCPLPQAWPAWPHTSHWWSGCLWIHWDGGGELCRVEQTNHGLRLVQILNSLRMFQILLVRWVCQWSKDGDWKRNRC